MAKKVSYSIPLRKMWKMYKEWCKVKDNSDAMAFYDDARRFADTQPDAVLRQSESLTLNFWLKDYKKEILHVWFVQKELRDFLRDDLPLKDLNGIKQYLKEEGEDRKTINADTGEEMDWVNHNIALHIPQETDGYVFSFCIMHDGTISLLFSGDKGVGLIHESQYNELKSRSDETAVNLVKNFNLAVNLLAYMRCFPECVKEGVPDTNNSNTLRYRDRSVQLGTSEKITSTVRGAMRPHFRKGYIKLLSSPFYTKKRGQLIWVSETSVNAKSKTVEMSDNEDKVQNFKSE